MSEHHQNEKYFWELVKAKGGPLGDPPSSDDLLAYISGQLTDEDSERIREYLAHDRITMNRFLDLIAHSGAPGDPDYVSDKVLREDWATLRRRLRLEGIEIESEPKQASLFFTRKRLWTERMVAVAAVLTIAILFGLPLRDRGRQVRELVRQLDAPRLNEASFRLLPDGTRGARGETGEEPPIRIRLGDVGAHLSLTLYDSPEYEDYRLDIFDAGKAANEAARWSTDAIVLLPGDTFEFGLPAGFLPPGHYVFRLYGIDDGEALLASYSVRLED